MLLMRLMKRFCPTASISSRRCRQLFATVGLGVSDFGYRIIGFSGFMSSMDSVHRHGHGKREAGDSVP